MRLSQVARILDTTTKKLVKLLSDKGYPVENNPNTQIDTNILKILAKQFNSNDLLSEQDNSINSKSSGLPGLKIIGKIDLNAKPKVQAETVKTHNDLKGDASLNELDVLDLIADIRHKIGLPDEVYKYSPINENLKNSLRDNYLYYNNPSNFNDPFDCSTRLIEFTEDYDQYIARLKRQKDSLADKITPAIFERLNEEREKTITLELASFGITCLSREPLNILMWSHYAHNHTGLCLEFKYAGDRNIYSSLDVYYSDELILTNFNNKPEIAIGNMIYTKSKDWEYEQELRIHKTGLKSQESRKIKFAKSALTGIIFGVKSREEDIEQIKEIIKTAKYPNVKFYKSFYVNGRFALEKREIK